MKCYESDLKDHKGTRTKEGTAVERQQKSGKQKASEGVTDEQQAAPGAVIHDGTTAWL